MRGGSALAACLVIAIAGCSTPIGPTPSTRAPTVSATEPSPPARDLTPTPTPALDLPPEVSRSSVRTFEALPRTARDAFRRARSGERVHVASAEAIDAFSDDRYVYADGRLWEVTLRIGATAIELTDVTGVNRTRQRTVTQYGNLTAEERRIVRKALNASGYYTVGADETFDPPSNYVRYRNRTYHVAVAHEDFDSPELDVDRYDARTTADG